jgi:hypothetical protein
MSAIRSVGVLGAGLMGSGIAEVCAKAGFTVVVREVDQKALDAGRRRIGLFLLQGNRLRLIFPIGKIKAHQATCDHRQADQSDDQGEVLGEQAAAWIHSTTLVARTRIDCGIDTRSALAVLLLITRSKVVARSMGRSPGFAPLSILSTKVAARRHI